MTKHPKCQENPHGCRKVCDGLVCQEVCEILKYDDNNQVFNVPTWNPFPENEGT